MTDIVQVIHQDGLAILTLAYAPANALGPPLRAALWAAVAAAEADPGVVAVVLSGAGRSFASAADVRDIGRPEAHPTLAALCLQLENCRKPVVLALQGLVVGGAMELALAAHYRVAAADARLGFGDIALGLVPGAGGTQRAPRLIGAGATISLMQSGAAMTAPEALALGLIDKVAQGDVLEAAIRLALADPVPRPTLSRDEHRKDVARYQAAIRSARGQAKAGSVLAVIRVVDCVEAALLLPVAAALEFERAAFQDCAKSEASVGLRHVFVAERRMARPPEARVKPRKCESVGLLGAGRIGRSLVLATISAGMRCVIIEKDRDALVAALQAIAGAQELAVSQGRLTEAARDSDWARLGGSVDLAALADVDLIIEALPEQAALKTRLLAEAGRVALPGAVLASTTEALDLDALAQATGRAADVIGLHLSVPLPEAQLVEVGAGAMSAPDALATGLALARRLGRRSILVRAAGPGGLVAARLAAACWAAGKVVARHGAEASAVTAALAALGADAETLSPQVRSIQRCCLAAMVNTAAGMLEAGMVARSSDIDMVSILGLGMPRWRGGILHMADRAGILALRRDLMEFAAEDPAIWTPHPMIQELFINGRRFGDLDET